MTRTPPEERLRRKREAEERANSEMAFLTLKPFCSIPRIAFDDIKIGKAAVRRITIQNPGKKPLKVSKKLGHVPKKSVNYVLGSFF